MKNLQTISRFLSLVLRHKPHELGIVLDKNGWADVSELLQKMQQKGFDINHQTLQTIVANNNKQRFKLNDDASKIRANQGHSVAVDVELVEQLPPQVLYHGTAINNLESIKKKGLISQTRLYVHLSGNQTTALAVGQRHGKAIVLTIRAAEMQQAGYTFYLSENQVWLTQSVPVQYIEFV